jgi:hypothetical protein
VTIPSAEANAGVEPTAAIRLVLGIARLGEADLMGWWSSQGLNPAVRFALAGFRRTNSIVGGELALLSAVRRHQQVLPRPNAVHLFSSHLPFVGWANAHVAELKTSGNSDLLDELRTWSTADHAAANLKSWSEDIPPANDRLDVVSSEDLHNPVITAGLLRRFILEYVTLPSQLDVPYVNFAR